MKPLANMGRATASGACCCLGAWALALCLFLGPASNARAGAATNAPASFPSLKEVRQKWDLESLDAVRRAAENGDLTAQHYLGFCYASGDRVLKDGATATQWYTRASGAGYLPSFINLGMLYQRGEVVPRDAAKALHYYQIAADAGLKQGQVNLGMLYRDGTGVPRDPVEALKWFRLAAAQGHTVAMTEIGRAYRSGQGVQQDADEAIKWFKQAAERGEPLAELNLGLIYEDEGRLSTAVKFYRQAAEHGLADAMWVMHNLYENGKGVRQDLAEADRWLLKGAEGGSLRAQTSLGYHHEYPSHDSGHRVGDGAASMAEAVKWYRRAADQNWADGQYRLASCYLEGKGVEPDEEHGLQLMRAAADKGHAKALVDLVELYAQGVGEPRNPDDEPMQLLERAVQVREEGPYGVYNRPYDLLIFRLEFGIRTARDLVAAAEWYCRAALAGAYNYSLEDKLNYSPSARRPLWSATGLAGHSPVQVVTTGGSGPDAPLSELLSVYLRAARPNGGKDALSIAERFGAARDVPVSPTRAWVWFHLAVQRGASEGAAQCRALEQKLTPAELAEARRQYDRLVEHLDAVWQVIRHNAEPHGSGRTN